MIRVGRGVVGKITVVAVVLIPLLAIIAYGLKSDPHLLFAFGIIVIASFSAFVWFVLTWASRNPDQALQEGTQVLQYAKWRMAAQGLANPPVQQAIADPHSLTQLPPPGSG